MSLSFQFCCPFEFCSCQLSAKEREERKRRGEFVKPCPFQRRIKILDSYLFIGAKLDDIVQQTHIAREKEGKSLETVFPSTLRFLQSKNLSERQIQLVIKKKFSMPYEMCESYRQLEEQVECPSSEQFASFLRGTEGLEETEMNNFREIWNELKIPNLLTLFSWYAQLDVLELGDAVNFFFNKMFQHCHLFPIWYTTLSSYALSAMLLNCASPDQPGRRLFLPFLSEAVHSEFERKLFGGFCSSQAFFTKFNHSRISLTDDLHCNHLVTWGAFMDANSLYPSVSKYLSTCT